MRKKAAAARVAQEKRGRGRPRKLAPGKESVSRNDRASDPETDKVRAYCIWYFWFRPNTKRLQSQRWKRPMVFNRDKWPPQN